MTSKQVALVQDSFAKVAPTSEPAAVLFYDHLFDIAHAQLAADPLHIDSLAPAGEPRIAGDQEEPEDTEQAGNDVLDHAVGAHALERQRYARRHVGYRVPRRSRRLLRDSRPQRAQSIRRVVLDPHLSRQRRFDAVFLPRPRR
jgi:hypothetical protein